MALVPDAVASEVCQGGVDPVTAGLSAVTAVGALIPNVVAKSTVGADVWKPQAWCRCGRTSGAEWSVPTTVVLELPQPGERGGDVKHWRREFGGKPLRLTLGFNRWA